MTSSITIEQEVDYSESLIYTEIDDDDDAEPTQEEIDEYAKRIGIDASSETHLLYLAKEGIQAKLPYTWSPCLDTSKNCFYYFNKETSASQWEHPMDSVYRDKVIRARGEIAMNRPPISPLTSLPPVRKAGASLGPIRRTLGGLGTLGMGPADLSQANQDLLPPEKSHNNQNSRNIISASSLKTFKESDDDDSQPLKPRKLGLTLTGGGANFLKGSNQSRLLRDSTPDSDSGGGGDSEKKPIKSILISRSRGVNQTENVYELDGFSMNAEEMTEDEKLVISQLDSVSSKSKGNVKFNLDDNTELKFEMPGDEKSEVEDEAESSESSRNSLFKMIRTAPLPLKKTPERPKTADSEPDLAAMKAAMRSDMEAELKRFKDQLESERKVRQEQIQKHLEETVQQYKLEKDENLNQMRRTLESEKNSEIDMTRKEIDGLLQNELKEMKTKFDDVLQEKRKELEEENGKKVEELTQEYRKREEERISQVIQMQSKDEIIQAANAELKKQKESLEHEHNKQILELKECQKMIIDKVKAEFQAEENKLRQENQARRNEIVTRFEKETEELRKKLVRSQEEALKKVQDDFEVKRTNLEKSLNASLQDMKDLIRKNKRSSSESNVNKEDDINWKVKYQKLEGKYNLMKAELKELSKNSGLKKVNLERQSPRKEAKKSFEINDSANGSETNSSDSSVYPSSEGIASKLTPEIELSEESHANKINAALQALEVLKSEILELKNPQKNPNLAEKPPQGKSRSVSARKPPEKEPRTARSKPSSVHISPKGSKSARVKDFSVGSGADVSEDAHVKIVEEAKAFIKMQKNRLKDPAPITNSSHLILPPNKNNLLLFDEKLLKSVSPRRPGAIHIDLVSETESSGVSSLKDHRSSESKKLSRDIDEICSSLNSLDQQMKYMWSVVKGKEEGNEGIVEGQSEIYNYDLSQFLLPNTVPLLGKGRVAQLPPNVRKPQGPPPSPIGMNGKNYSSLLNNAQSSNGQTVLEALRMSGMSTSRLDCSELLKSLEEELKEFKSTKQKLLEMQGQNKMYRVNGGSTSILEKTKDLQEWLKKY